MLIILSQKIDTESSYSDELFDTYHYPARYRNQIHEGDTFIYYQGNRYDQEQRYYFGVGIIGKIRTEDGENYYADLLKVRRFKNKVPIYLVEGHYIEELGYDTVRKRLRPPWQSSIRPLSQSAFDCIISRAGSLLEVKNEESVYELKENLKTPIRHFYSGDNNSIKEIIEIASAIKERLFPKESIPLLQSRGDMYEITDPLAKEEKSFIDYCRKTKMVYSYKMLLILAFLSCSDIEGKLEIDKAVKFFREYFTSRRNKGLIIEKKPCIYHDLNVTDNQIRKNLISNPVKALVNGGFFEWESTTGVLSMPQSTWRLLSKNTKEKIRKICEQRLKDYFQND